MVAIPLASVFGTVALVSTSLVGWSLGVEAKAIERVWGEKWLLTVSALAGGCTGALLSWGFTNRRFILLGVALLGVMPAMLKASAYFTNAY